MDNTQKKYLEYLKTFYKEDCDFTDEETPYQLEIGDVIGMLETMEGSEKYNTKMFLAMVSRFNKTFKYYGIVSYSNFERKTKIDNVLEE